MMHLRGILWCMTLLCVINISRQECEVSSGRIECKYITAFPDLIRINPSGEKISAIRLTNSNFTSLPANAFQSQYLTHLTIIQTTLEIIEPSAFNNLPKLDYLFLAINNISTIPNGTFNHLTNLTHLDLSHNNIRFIEKNLLMGTSIRVLFLEYNKIEDMSSTVDYCDSYEKLDMSHNAISVFYSLSNCTRLRELNMGSNKISQLRNKLFPRSLTSLDLRENQIESVEAETFLDMGQLDTLNLAKNRLYKLYYGSIPLGLFQPLTGLKKLNLAFNGISQLLPGTFTKLTFLNNLDMGHNNLSYFSTGLLRGLPLTFLSIRNNQFTNLEYHSFNSEYDITIDLDENQWSCEYLSHMIRHILIMNPNNKIVSGDYINVPNINGTKCNPTKRIGLNVTMDASPKQTSSDILKMIGFSIGEFEADQEETNKLLVSIKDLLHNITVSKSSSSILIENRTASAVDILYNISTAIAENTKQLQSSSKQVEGTIQIGKSQFVMLSILLAIIALTLLISAVFAFAVYRKCNAKLGIPQDTLLDTY